MKTVVGRSGEPIMKAYVCVCRYVCMCVYMHHLKTHAEHLYPARAGIYQSANRLFYFRQFAYSVLRTGSSLVQHKLLKKEGK